MALITRLSEFCGRVETKLVDNMTFLGLKAVYYGDQDKLATTPVACVEPDEKQIELKSAQRMVRLDFTCYVIVYHSFVQSGQLNRREADALAEDIEELLEADRELGGGVIHCMVTNVASGYARKANSLVRASRITFTGQSQALLPS